VDVPSTKSTTCCAYTIDSYSRRANGYRTHSSPRSPYCTQFDSDPFHSSSSIVAERATVALFPARVVWEANWIRDFVGEARQGCSDLVSTGWFDLTGHRGLGRAEASVEVENRVIRVLVREQEYHSISHLFWLSESFQRDGVFQVLFMLFGKFCRGLSACS
jgi:hypothetical protein